MDHSMCYFFRLKERECRMDPSMYRAATCGDVGFLQRIRDGDESTDLLSQKTPKGNNILHLAAEFEQINFFKDPSFEKGSPLLWNINKMGDTPLHIAARVGCVELVAFLIDRAKMLHVKRVGDQERGTTYAESYKKLLRKTNLEMHTALHVAARYGHHGVAISLMKADPELCCSTYSAKESPLFLATCKGFSNIARDILNESSISPSFNGIKGVTALHAAVTHTNQGAEGIVELMVSKHPNIIKRTDDELGWTPLHYAAFIGNLEAIRLLMQWDNFSSSYILDKYGMSALHIAAYRGHTEVMKELIQCWPDTCERLNAKDQTILHVAVLGAQSKVVEYLVKNLKIPELRMLIRQVDRNGNTPVHLAVIGQNHEISRMLTLDCRVDSTAIDKGFSLVFDNFLGEDIKIQTASALGNVEKEDPNLPPSNKAEQNREGSSVVLGKGSDKLEMSTDTSHQGRSFGVPLFHEQISRDFKKFELHPDQNNDSDLEKNSENNLVIATLIATVTFTAAVAPPGGCNDNGKNILQDNADFRWFQAFNMVSFIFSFLVLLHEPFAMYLKIISSTAQKISSSKAIKVFIAKFLDRIEKIIFSRPQKDFIFTSLYGMFLAFGMASRAVQTEPGKSMSVDHWISVAATSFLLFPFGSSLFYAWIARRKKRSGSS